MSMNAPEPGSNVQRVAIGLAAIALSVLVTWAVTMGASDYVITLLALLFINAALAVSLTVSNGLSGLFSLGHPAFMTIGAYVAAILTFPSARKATMLPALPEFIATMQWPLLPALLAAAVVGIVVAIIVGFPVLRLRGHYLAVATLGLIIIVQNLATNWSGLTRGGAGLSGIPRLGNIWWALGLLITTIIFMWRIKFSSLGRAMMATRENDIAAECTGIDTTRIRMIAFVCGAVAAALAGALLVHVISVVTPKTYGIVLAFNLVAMVVIGGQGSITGALIAAAAISMLSESLRPVEESVGLYGLSQVIVALALILALYFRPGGLFGSREPILLQRLLNGRETS